VREGRRWESSGRARTMSATTRRNRRVALGPPPPRARTLAMAPSGASALTSSFMVARAKVSTPSAHSVDFVDASRWQAVLDPDRAGARLGAVPDRRARAAA